MIRAMRAEDLDGVVAIHLDSFPGFFLTFLGPRFLALLYEGIRADPEGIVLVASSGEGIDGFVAGVTRQSGFYRRLLDRKKWAFAGAALHALLRRPAIAPRLLRALRRPAHAKESGAEACLMSIAVRPGKAGKGIGRDLVGAFCAALKERGVDAVCLMAYRDENESVVRFYEELGFSLNRSITTPEGRAMNEYVLRLGPGK